MRVQHLVRTMMCGVAIFAIAAGPAAAQHEGHQMPGMSGAAAPEKVASCVQNSQAVTQTLDAANVRIEDARQLNSAAAMRAAIGDLQVALAQMKVQLADCVALATSTMPGMDHSSMPAMDHSKMAATTAPAESTPAQSPKTTSGSAVITLKTQPTPPQAGDNQFEVTLRDADGKSIADAEVSIALYMPPMPSMPAMRGNVKLTSAGNGVYRGEGTIGMPGEWDVTITAVRKGQTLGVKKQKLTAQ